MPQPFTFVRMVVRVFVFTRVLAGTANVWAEAKLRLAFASYREQPKHPRILFYDHDGQATGQMLEGIPIKPKRSDSHPILSHNGRLCVLATEQENETSRIQLWDTTEKKFLETPTLNDSPNAQLWPTMSGDARTVIFAGWNRPGSSQRWDLFSFDVTTNQTRGLADVNTLVFDERMPAISGDGRVLAFVTNATSGAGLSDIVLCELATGTIIPTPGLNSASRDVEPALSHDGRFVAFVSDRAGTVGGRDIFLYDRQTSSLVPVPGLNSIAHEQSPSLSQSGRFLVFVSERIHGEGERDVFLYSRERQSLLPTPALNARSEDFDPSIVELDLR